MCLSVKPAATKKAKAMKTPIHAYKAMIQTYSLRSVPCRASLWGRRLVERSIRGRMQSILTFHRWNLRGESQKAEWPRLMTPTLCKHKKSAKEITAGAFHFYLRAEDAKSKCGDDRHLRVVKFWIDPKDVVAAGLNNRWSFHPTDGIAATRCYNSENACRKAMGLRPIKGPAPRQVFRAGQIK